MDPVDIEHKSFRTKLLGLDPREVEGFLQDLTEEIRRLRTENSGCKKDLQEIQRELNEHKEREASLRAVLASAQQAAEQTRANAEREAHLIVSEAEVKAERILQDAHQQLASLRNELFELKRRRVEFEARTRSLLDTLRQVLDSEGEETAAGIEELRN